MGRSRNRQPPRPAGVSRRTFLKSAAGAALGAAPLAPAIAAVQAAGATTVQFLHGVASGDPLAHRVVLWTRVTPPAGGPVAVSVVVARDPGLTDVVRTGTFNTGAWRDHTVKIDVGG